MATTGPQIGLSAVPVSVLAGDVIELTVTGQAAHVWAELVGAGATVSTEAVAGRILLATLTFPGLATVVVHAADQVGNTTTLSFPVSILAIPELDVLDIDTTVNSLGVAQAVLTGFELDLAVSAGFGVDLAVSADG